jgi:tellurite methyltransferase
MANAGAHALPVQRSNSNPANETERAFWNDLYRAHSHRSLEPDDSFVAVYRTHIAPRLAGLPGKSALDLAGGVGRNALFLAREGWRVTLNELSDEAAHLAVANAAHSGVSLGVLRESAAETLARARSDGARYNLILILYYLDRALFPALRHALEPGGMVYIKTRTTDHPRFAGGSSHPEYYLRPGELRSAFPGLHTVYELEEQGMAELLVQA